MSPSKITVLFDPLCGWCYGASAMVKWLSAQPSLNVDYCPTGLFANDSAPPLSEAFAKNIVEADKRITQMTGMEFSDIYRKTILGDRTTPVNSRPATMALVSVWLDDPSAVIDCLSHIQRARYVEGLDITDIAVLISRLKALGQAIAAERLEQNSPDLISAYHRRIETGQSLMLSSKARGVPALIVEKNNRLTLLSSDLLFGGQEELLSTIEAL